MGDPPSLKHPTLELRVADSCTRVDDTLAIAALYRCLVRHLARDPQAQCRTAPARRAPSTTRIAGARSATASMAASSTRRPAAPTRQPDARRDPGPGRGGREGARLRARTRSLPLDHRARNQRRPAAVPLHRGARTGSVEPDALAEVVDWLSAETVGRGALTRRVATERRVLSASSSLRLDPGRPIYTRPSPSAAPPAPFFHEVCMARDVSDATPIGARVRTRRLGRGGREAGATRGGSAPSTRRSRSTPPTPRPSPTRAKAASGRCSTALQARDRLGADPRGRPPDRALRRARRRRHLARARRAVRALRRARRDPSRDRARDRPSISRDEGASAETLGIGFLTLGMSPLWTRAETPVMPKARYRIMTDYMPKVGTLRPRHDVPHRDRAGEPRLRLRSRHGEEAARLAGAAADRDRALRQLARSPTASRTASCRCAPRSGATPTTTAPA